MNYQCLKFIPIHHTLHASHFDLVNTEEMTQLCIFIRLGTCVFNNNKTRMNLLIVTSKVMVSMSRYGVNLVSMIETKQLTAL